MDEFEIKYINEVRDHDLTRRRCSTPRGINPGTVVELYDQIDKLEDYINALEKVLRDIIAEVDEDPYTTPSLENAEEILERRPKGV